MKSLRIRLTILLFIGSSVLFAQSKKEADALFEKGNFTEAFKVYEHLLQNSPDNYHYNFRAGVCLLNISVIKSKAIPYLTKASSFPNEDPISFYLLGKAYQYSYQFDPAIRAYEKFISLSTEESENVRYAKKKIEYCYNAKEFMKFPLNLTFENLGDSINSQFPDFFPFISSDESFIVFNSKRDDGSNRLADGSFSSNIYISEVTNGEYRKAVKLNGIGADSLNEKVIGLSADGSKILYSIEEDKSVQIYLADFNNLKIENSVKLDLIHNEKVGPEVTASISSDGNSIFISTELENSIGGHDIYITRRLPNGRWGKLENLGPEINTDWDEKYPNVSRNNKNLYFSSEGHTGLGGMDIYASEWDPKQNKWTSVKNMGYPLNTPDDDMNFCKAAADKHGYLSVMRKGGYGDLDIYRVTFGDGEPIFSIVTGSLYSVNTTQLKDDVFISVIEKSRNRVYGEYIPNTRTGRYVMALPPGKYELYVEVPGFETIQQSIEILDKSSYRPFIHQDMVLKPVGILMKLPEMSDQ